LFAFTKKFEQKYPSNPECTESRKKLYAEKGKQLKLSDIFNANSAECAEIAVLAQGYLQEKGFSSSYFSGDVLWSKEHEFSEEHTFIIIRQGDKVYIYDPPNPTSTTSGKFPSIYIVEANFDGEMAKGQKRFVRARNILSRKEAFFGVNDGTNVVAEEHIV
jgi:restriction endonuclease S subunit